MSKQKIILLIVSLGLSCNLLKAQESGRISRLEEYLLKASALDLHHQVLDSAPMAKKLGLSTPEFFKIYGWSLYCLNKPLEAATQYRNALKLNQDDSLAKSGLYFSLRDAGEQQEAHFWRAQRPLKDNGIRSISVEGVLATGSKPNYGSSLLTDSAGAATTAWQREINGWNISGQVPLSKRTIINMGFSHLAVYRSSLMLGIEFVLKDSTFSPSLGYIRNYSLDTLTNIQQLQVKQYQGLIQLSHRLTDGFFLQLQYQLLDVQANFQNLMIRDEAFQFQPLDTLPSYRIKYDFNSKREGFVDQVLLAGFQWRLGNFKWMATGGLRSFYGTNAPLFNTELLWNPFGNGNSYIMPGWNTDFTTTIASIQAGIRLFRGTWLESQFFYGNLTGAVSNSGAIVWNLPDKTRLRLTANLIRRIGSWGELSLRYGYTELESTRISYRIGATETLTTFNYNIHSFVTGLKFFF